MAAKKTAGTGSDDDFRFSTTLMMPQTGPPCSAPHLQKAFSSKVSELWPGGLPRRAVLAVSGGADSTALTLLAKDILPGWFEHLVVAHFNHHLREEEADSEADFVRDLAVRFEIPFVQGDWVPEERQTYHRVDRNLQAAARRARYSFLFETAKEHDCAILLTAHHARDQIETILHNLSRGGKSGAFSGIRPRIEREGICILRPLLWAFPEELRSFLTERDQTYCDDSSNASLKYRRNWIRNELLPKISDAYPPFEREWIEKWNHFREESQEVEALYEGLKLQSLRRESGWVIPLSGLRKLNSDQQVSCLRLFLRDAIQDRSPHGWDPIRQAPMEQLLEMVKGGEEGVVNLPGGIRVQLKGQGLTLSI